MKKLVWLRPAGIVIGAVLAIFWAGLVAGALYLNRENTAMAFLFCYILACLASNFIAVAVLRGVGSNPDRRMRYGHTAHEIEEAISFRQMVSVFTGFGVGSAILTVSAVTFLLIMNSSAP